MDLVFCIDATGSMGPVLDMVKERAISFYGDVTNAMVKKNKSIDNLRIRIIAFRDYVADGDEAMMITEFFDFPEESAGFAEAIHSIQAKGGGDEPEDGLEALGYAIKSKWASQGMKRRQVIVVWTDASTHDIGYGRHVPGYPTGMASDFGELTSWWGDEQNQGFMDENGKRLLLFTPDVPYWNAISEIWDNVLHFPSNSGEGLAEFTYNEILDCIANSI